MSIIVCHVRCDSAGASQPWESALSSVADEVVEPQDVYLALAWLTGKGEPPVNLVIVAVDGLTEDEFEFFSLLSKHRPTVRLLAYGSHDAIQQAIDAGAEGPVTESAVSHVSETMCDARAVEAAADQGVVSGRSETVSGSETGFADAGKISTDAHHDVSPTEGRDALSSGQGKADRIENVNEPPDATSGSETHGPGGGDNLTRPVRVPWLSNDEVPMRTAPPRQGPREEPPRAADEPLSAGRVEGGDEPLLSEEELRALFDDEDGSET